MSRENEDGQATAPMVGPGFVYIWQMFGTL